MNPARITVALLLVALYGLLCWLVCDRHRQRKRLAAREAAALLPAANPGTPMLVLHASQTGQAEDIAWQSARFLHVAGEPVRLAALGEIRRADLQAATHLLVIASTAGEGDAPDSAVTFVRDVMGATDALDLKHLRIGVLALGDSSYTHFCRFGRTLDAWLRRQGGQPMFGRIEVDRLNPQAMAQWRHQLSHLGGPADLPDWDAPVFAPWTLRARRHLNPLGQGGGVFHLELVPAGNAVLPNWAAGDLVQVAIKNQRPRDYTVASLPADGCVQLLVRRSCQADGRPGQASGHLSSQLAVGEVVALRLRANPRFRIGANANRPLILIGNGTGLAGLRAHLKGRAAQPAPSDAWLLFGERQATHDAHYRAEIEAWQAKGLLARVDWAFSRDQAEPRYVQHVLAEQAVRVHEWAAKGAAIYVCGSLQGMASAVDEALRKALGDAWLNTLTEQGRYRRDVY